VVVSLVYLQIDRDWNVLLFFYYVPLVSPLIVYRYGVSWLDFRSVQVGSPVVL